MLEGPVTFVQIVVLALLQGLTEFLPVSSSAHLILVPALTGWPDQGLEMDVAVHFGTLGAVVIYFRRDVGRILGGLMAGLAGRPTVQSGLAGKLVVATLPLLGGGLALVALELDRWLRQPIVLASATIGFAVLLYLVDRYRPQARQISELNYRDAILIGALQALALIPGTSRAGITITGARGLGYSRLEAARFSMLLSIPAILAASGYATLKLLRGGDSELGVAAGLAALLAFLAALVSIDLMMRWLRRASFTPFVIYRLALGAGLLWWIYG